MSSNEKLEGVNPFAQNQYQEASTGNDRTNTASMGDSLNFESSFWQDESLQPAIKTSAYDDVSAYSYEPNSSAYDDDPPSASKQQQQQQQQSQPKANPITSILSNMKTKLMDNDATKSNGAHTVSSYTAPAYDPPGMGSNSNQTTSSNTDSYKITSNASLQNMSEEELDQKEQYLDRREKELLAKQERLKRARDELNSNDIRRDNWPCSYYAITYHSIATEIPIYARAHMKRMYTLVLLTFLALFTNSFAEMVRYFQDLGTDSEFLFSILFLFCGVVGAWRLWYRQIYYGIRDRKTLKWWCFFLFFVAHICFSIIMSLGIEKWGGAGFITFINAFHKGKSFAGFVCLVSASLWVMLSIGSSVYLKKSWRMFRKEGGMEQTQSDASGLIARHAADLVV